MPFHRYYDLKQEQKTLKALNIKPSNQSPIFARIRGVIDWCCPNCNMVHQSPVKPRYKALYCLDCDSTWEYGLTFYQSPRGRREIPRDTIIIADGFTHRRLVNRVFCMNCDEEIKKPTKP
jgi:hypothetical protein